MELQNFNIPNPPNNDWFNRIYACIQNNKNGKNGSFDCYKFQTPEEAFTFVSMERLKKNNKDVLIPMCKWTPKIFDGYLLEKKLKIYNKINN